MKATSTQKSKLQKNIDQQLQEILENEIRKVKNGNNRNALFLQLFAA
jgi:hypothetical protein